MLPYQNFSWVWKAKRGQPGEHRFWESKKSPSNPRGEMVRLPDPPSVPGQPSPKEEDLWVEPTPAAGGDTASEAGAGGEKQPWEMSEEEYVESKRPPRKPGVTYYEELPEEKKQEHRKLMTEALESLDTRQYPLRAETSEGEKVNVLGPVSRFPPYDDPSYGKRSPGDGGQLMVERADGTRAIMFANSLLHEGKTLIPKIPPTRGRGLADTLARDAYRRMMESRKKA